MRKKKTYLGKKFTHFDLRIFFQRGWNSTTNIQCMMSRVSLEAIDPCQLIIEAIRSSNGGGSLSHSCATTGSPGHRSILVLKLVGRWGGKSRIGVVWCLDFSMTFEGWRMQLTEKMLLLIWFWFYLCFGRSLSLDMFFCLLILFKHFLDVLFSPATSTKGWRRIISTSICS